MDLSWSPEEQAFRAEARDVARRQRPGRAAAVRRHPRGLRPPPRVGAHAVRRPLRGGVVARGVRRPRRQPLGVADLRGGVLPRRRAAAGHAERHLPARADDLRVRHAGAAGPHPRRRWRRRGDVVPGLVGARRRQRPRRHPEPSAMRDDAAGGWRLTGQKTWTTRGAFCTHLFGLFRTDPTAERHRGLTYFLVPLDTPGVTVRGVRAPRRRRGLRRGVLRRRVRARRPTCSASVDEGWGVAMATTGSERGLTLRSPGRFLAAARPADRRSRASGPPTRATRRSAHRVAQAWIDAEAYRLPTLRTVTRIARRRSRRAPSRASTKVFWSELDVRLHETALDAARPRRRAARRRRGVDEGLRVRARRARSTPAPTRSSAT